MRAGYTSESAINPTIDSMVRALSLKMIQPKIPLHLIPFWTGRGVEKAARDEHSTLEEDDV